MPLRKSYLSFTTTYSRRVTVCEKSTCSGDVFVFVVKQIHAKRNPEQLEVLFWIVSKEKFAEEYFRQHSEDRSGDLIFEHAVFALLEYAESNNLLERI